MLFVLAPPGLLMDSRSWRRHQVVQDHIGRMTHTSRRIRPGDVGSRHLRWHSRRKLPGACDRRHCEWRQTRPRGTPTYPSRAGRGRRHDARDDFEGRAGNARTLGITPRPTCRCTWYLDGFLSRFEPHEGGSVEQRPRGKAGNAAPAPPQPGSGAPRGGGHRADRTPAETSSVKELNQTQSKSATGNQDLGRLNVGSGRRSR